MRFRWLTVCLTPILGAALLTTPALAKEHFKASLDGAQEVPPTGSAGIGSATMIIDPNTDTIFYHIAYSGLGAAETAAHIHGYAPPGVNAGVVHPLPAGTPKIGSWTYPAADEAQIMGGLTYVNIHTTAFGGGEIRGQVLFEPATDIVSVLQGSQEVPPTGSAGLGIGAYDVDFVANTLAYDIRFAGLGSAETAAHFHGGAAGVNGGVLVALPAGSPKVGVWNFNAAAEVLILAGSVYANVHSAGFGGGEIRGQFENVSGTVGVQVTLPGTSELSLLAAPNPLPHDDLALFYRAPAGQKVTVDIVDVTGRVVRTIGDATSTRTGLFAWDTRDDSGTRVSGGVYFARLRSGAGETTTRFVVLR